MDLIALRSFREVHRTGSITAAARVLGYTQSALSRQLASLETGLGTPLLRRHARGVRLTPAGEALLAHGTAILRHVDHAERDVRASLEQPVTSLRVGSVPSAVASLLPRALTAFTAEVPLVRVTFTEEVTPTLLPRLLDGDLDCAVVTSYPPGLPAHADLAVTPLLDDPLVCVLPRDHPVAALDVVPLAALAEETWVEDYEGAASALAMACARAGFTPRIDVECGGWLGKQAFVAEGHGVMLAPRLLLPSPRPDALIRPLADPPRRSVYAATRRRPGSAAAPLDAFVRALTRTATADARPEV
ncbi:LysR family transcriptional regulator [Streptomyces profundus]|uniref:LysR family transcriptional regulator n=1 Tax=Streptomyces profundus TaxID=2867410 RepID=UPI001D162A8E|nr:LysR family transcriptional regulator [Streptomyces sp. MA3_2.13]UED87643.1 LysR family transcriptional regulator [Streptomyces sp. MA3_2.13]